MSRFRKTEKKRVPSLNMASLPDLIFTLLFFFMIVANMRDDEPKVELQLPLAEKIEKQDRSSTVLFIYVGREGEGETPFIQINNELLKPEEVDNYIENKKAVLDLEDPEKLSATLKIDKEAKMGLVTDIKQSLRKAGILNINYIAVDDEN